MYAFTADDARLLHKLIDGHCKALKTWTAAAVERGDLEGAQKLVVELREHERLFAKTNVEAHLAIARATGKAA